LRAAGWRVLVIWECQVGQPQQLLFRISRFLGRHSPPHSAKN
jgi:G:T-mismatch repair DNA endonuclease (very short patch repair protein)